MGTLAEAREVLRARQGKGARYDAPEAPADALGLARRGTAYFARVLNWVEDDALYAPSGVPGWTRAHVVVDVAYHARALCRQLDAAAPGEVAAMYESDAARLEEIELGGVLPPRALRHLADHAAIHLDVTWRDLPGRLWVADAPDSTRRMRPLSATPAEHAALLWFGALDLAHGARPRDLPVDFAGATPPRHNPTSRPRA